MSPLALFIKSLLTMVALGQFALAFPAESLAKRSLLKSAVSTPNMKRDLASDLGVVQSFMQEITYDPNGILGNWTGDNVCEYNGFYCGYPPNSQQLALASIDFNQFRLGGPSLSLEGFLDKFTELALFHANSNGFTGSVPDLSALSYLYELDLSNNDLSGPFPIKALTAPLGLTFLDLRFNFFEGELPDNIFTFSSELEALFLNSNTFSGSIPDHFASSPAQYISLANNQFTGSVPAGIGSAPNLQQILLLGNQLTGTLPDELANAANLSVLDIGSNQLTGGVPEALCSLPAWANGVLNLTSNYLTEPLGTTCLTLEAAGLLDVSNNCIRGAANQRAADECSK